PVGSAVTQRRVYYPQAPSGDGVPMARGELEGSTASGAGSAPEKDLWAGLGIPFTDGLTPSEEAARIEAKRILDATYSIKIGRLDPTDPATEIQFLLGDTFHADPVVLGGPTSNLLFAQNFNDYRDFATKHRFRRKMLATATNDGMLHFFDAGVAEIVSDQVKFTNGTGKEIVAFVPRTILPKLKPLADGTSHLWSVDGGLAIADVYLDPTHNGSPVAADREWRTVLVAGLRRGGEIVYALDITQPDALKEKNLAGPPAQTVIVPKNPGTIPDCHNTLGGGADLACDDELKFPSVLWEFSDTVEVDGQRFRLDEDDNGELDLAFTWSKPNIGRIQVDEGGTIVDKFVAVFGGGLDPDKPTTRGDWLYIVDIETGQAIYKQQLEDPYTLGLSGGAAPSEPAAVDINQDGLLDRIYIGTTGGYLYRVDLGPDSSGDLPKLVSHTLRIETQPGVFKDVQVPRITDPKREPRVIFDSINSVTAKRLPLFFRPSVLFTPLLAPHFGLALGDGDRENLWSLGQSPGRFYVFADNTDPSDPADIITADLLETVPPGLTGADFLFNPQVGKRNGWVLDLAADERTVSDAFALAGITVFTTYTPDQPVAPGPGGGPNKNLPRLCSRTGKSKVFAVMTTNANGVLFDTNNDRTRSTGVDTLIGKAFADLSATQNAPSGGGNPPPSPPPPLPPNRQLIFDELKKLFPSNCRFANYRIDIRAIASDTEIIEVAPVPVCIIEKNWREF
ncbi:MAG: hypothetical protein IH936_01535, partial [Acidobacteria bacterium]|nr:hypothetical protein [Acidobacteriota bacterium]